METLTGSPFTLVVKAPNQEISDQTIECFLDWTVRKLKKHLSTVYPNNPNEWSQKIIYSGRLLQDNSLLKDVLSVTDIKDKYTVHLVCTPSPQERIKREASARSAKESVSARPSMTPSVSNSDGLRQRVTVAQAPSPSQQQSANISPNATLPSAIWSPSSPGPFPLVPGMATQQQWMQQVYAQQMAAYMQYASMVAASSGIQTGWNQGYQMPSAWIQPSQIPAMRHPAEPVPDQAIAPPEVNQPQEAAPAAPPANDNNLQRMNVGGGQALDDDDDGIRRDWLDWLFMLCRFGILLSIVYFYSSVNRFIVVAGAMFVMYLYQAGFFRLRRRQRVRPPVTPPQEAAPGREETPQDGTSDGMNDQLEESDSSTNSSDDGDGDGTEGSAEPQEPPRPGVLATTWVFISTFFTSIIPQGPAQQFPAN